MTKGEAKTFLCSIAGDLGFTDIENYTCKDGEKTREAIKALEQDDILDKIRAEIEQKIEQEEFARSVFRHEEKDTVKAEQCTGSIMAYNNVIKLIDKYKAESEE
jgi:5-methylthioribose kinase